MYLLVFVTLVVALIGAYSQIFTRQSVDAFSRRSGVVNTMYGWHTTAYSIASYLVTKSNLDGVSETGCLLTSLSGMAGEPLLNRCQSSSGNVNVGMTSGSHTACAPVPVAPCLTPLPVGDGTIYKYYSAAYKIDDIYYVLTFVPPPKSGTYNILCLPGNVTGTNSWACPNGHVQVSTTISDLSAQLSKNPVLSTTAYGTVRTTVAECGGVTAPCLVSSSSPPVVYRIPASVAPAGSIGIISIFAPHAT
jgi:hypothetical protein